MTVVERKAIDAVAKAEKRARRDGKPATVPVHAVTNDLGRAIMQAEAWVREDGTHIVVFRLFGETWKLDSARRVSDALGGLLAEDVGELPAGPAVDEAAPPL